MSHSLLIVSTFDCNKRCHILFYYHFLFFFNSKNNVATNLNPLNSVKNFFSLFLIADSVNLSSSSWLKEFQVLTL